MQKIPKLHASLYNQALTIIIHPLNLSTLSNSSTFLQWLSIIISFEGINLREKEEERKKEREEKKNQRGENPRWLIATVLQE